MHRTYQRLLIGLLLVLVTGIGGWAPATYADDETAPSGPLSKLTIHGFLTQAYATATFATGGFFFPHPDEVALGVPEDGTFDYRNLALQFRYQMTDKDIMIIQFSSRSLGNSVITQGEDEIELDWAFYQRNLGDNSSIKVGRVQIPFGIFNEIRDVGTILPFYRPSFLIYREGSFTSETVDGLVLSHTFFTESEWSLEADVYFGEWELVEAEPFEGLESDLARAEDGIGFQLWLNTPVSGLRLGFAGHQEKISGGQAAFRAPGERQSNDNFNFSLDYVLDKFVFRAEAAFPSFGQTSSFNAIKFDQTYLQFGYHATEKFRIYVQYEFGVGKIDKDDFSLVLPFPVTADISFDFRQDLGISLNYLFSPSLVLKLEHHQTEHEEFGLDLVFGPTGPTFTPIFLTADGGDYTILSLSASF